MSDKWAYARDALKGVLPGKPNEVLLWDLCKEMAHDGIRAALLSPEAIEAGAQAVASSWHLDEANPFHQWVAENVITAALEAAGIGGEG